MSMAKMFKKLQNKNIVDSAFCLKDFAKIAQVTVF